MNTMIKQLNGNEVDLTEREFTQLATRAITTAAEQLLYRLNSNELNRIAEAQFQIDEMKYAIDNKRNDMVNIIMQAFDKI